MYRQQEELLLWPERGKAGGGLRPEGSAWRLLGPGSVQDHLVRLQVLRLAQAQSRRDDGQSLVATWEVVRSKGTERRKLRTCCVIHKGGQDISSGPRGSRPREGAREPWLKFLGSS